MPKIMESIEVNGLHKIRLDCGHLQGKPRKNQPTIGKELTCLVCTRLADRKMGLNHVVRIRRLPGHREFEASKRS